MYPTAAKLTTEPGGGASMEKDELAEWFHKLVPPSPNESTANGSMVAQFDPSMRLLRVDG